MKPNELTIGAWVQEYLPIPDKMTMPMQVVGIFNDSIAYLDFGGNEGDVFEAEIENLRGIPLTKEILQKNGFTHKCIIEPDEHYPEGLFEWEKGAERNWLTLSVGSNKIGCDWRLHVDNCDRDSIGHVAVQYVHQLQNFLNILGIEMKVVV
jgi:hypothetical protein